MHNKAPWSATILTRITATKSNQVPSDPRVSAPSAHGHSESGVCAVPSPTVVRPKRSREVQQRIDLGFGVHLHSVSGSVERDGQCVTGSIHAIACAADSKHSNQMTHAMQLPIATASPLSGSAATNAMMAGGPQLPDRTGDVAVDAATDNVELCSPEPPLTETVRLKKNHGLRTNPLIRARARQ